MSTPELTKDEVKAAARAQGKCDSCQWNSATDTCILTSGCRHVPAIRQAASDFTVIHAGTPIERTTCGKCGYTFHDNGLPHVCAPVERALATQVGGGHYKSMAIQPFEYIHKNGIGFAEGCAIKYLSRWRAKGGVEDLRKARHFIDLLIEMEGG